MISQKVLISFLYILCDSFSDCLQYFFVCLTQQFEYNIPLYPQIHIHVCGFGGKGGAFILHCVLWTSCLCNFGFSLVLEYSQPLFPWMLSSAPFPVPRNVWISVTHVLDHLIIFLQVLDALYMVLNLFALCFSLWLISIDWSSSSLILSRLCWVYWWVSQRHSSSLLLCFSFLAFSLILSSSFYFSVEITHMMLSTFFTGAFNIFNHSYLKFNVRLYQHLNHTRIWSCDPSVSWVCTFLYAS